MHPYQPKLHQQKAPRDLQRFLLITLLISLSVLLVCILVIGQVWRYISNRAQQHPTPVVVLTPKPSLTQSASPTSASTATSTVGQAQRIDTYINNLTQTQ